MVWTIRNKIISIGAIAVLSLSLIAGISLTSSFNVQDNTNLSNERQNQIKIVSDMRLANIRLILGAMDSIVDKDSGSITPERMQLINDSAKFLKSHLNQLVEIADTEEERQLAITLGKNVEALAKGIQGDLVRLIESRAGESEFAVIDNVLDEAGGLVEDGLRDYVISVQAEVDVAMNDTRIAAASSITTTSVAFAISLVVLIGLLFAVSRSILAPISNMTNAMQSLAKGDMDVDLPSSGDEDEIGKMATSVQVFKDSMIENEKATETRRAERAEREERSRNLEALTTAFGRSVTGSLEKVSSSATRMESTAQSLAATAEQTQQQSSMVASASDETTTNVQTVASATEELSSSIHEISRQVSQSTDISATAVVEVQNTNEKIQGLAEAANKIDEVVAMITDIADQTNLLALNATIEAARAGDAGKGFAVVASEVKNLANQTAKATEDISAQISGVQGATQEAVTAIGSIGGTINQLNEISSAIAAAVEEQGAATQEISRNVEQAASGTSQVSSNIAGVTEAARKTSTASSDVLSAAQEMSHEATTLKEEVETFLKDVNKI